MLRSILRSLRRSMIVATDTVHLLHPRTVRGADVLIVNPMPLGDMLVWLTSAATYRDAFPKRRLILLANSAWASYAEGLMAWDEVWSLDRSRFGDDLPYRRQTLERVRRHGFDAVICPMREMRIGDSIARVSGARLRIGSSEDEKYNGRGLHNLVSDRWYTRIIRVPPRSRANEFESHRLFAQALAGQDMTRAVSLRPFAGQPSGTAVKEDYFVVFVGANDPKRRWPISHYAAAARHVAERRQWRCVICGGATEKELGAALAQHLVDLRPVDMTGRTTLAQFEGILARARLYLGNETGAAHMAAQLGVRSVVLAGGGDFGRFVPYPPALPAGIRPPAVVQYPMECYGCRWACRYAPGPSDPAPCIANIAAAHVIEAVDRLLDDRP